MTAIFAENELNIVDVFGKNELWEGLKVYKTLQKTAKLLKTIFAINFSKKGNLIKSKEIVVISLDKDKLIFTLPPGFGFL